MKYFKVLDADRMTYHGGSGQWPPPGEWREIEGEIIPCKNGLHGCREQDLVEWLGPEIWEMEFDGELVTANNKVIGHRARLIRRLDTWTPQAAAKFAQDCTDHVAHLNSVYVSYAKAPSAWAARAAEYAAQAAAYAAQAAAYAAYAARAARAAAAEAAWAAGADARDAADRDERDWQSKKLMEILYPSPDES
jgi:hypothetical protein